MTSYKRSKTQSKDTSSSKRHWGRRLSQGTFLIVQNAIRFQPEDRVIIGEEVREIDSICNWQTLILTSPLTTAHAIGEPVAKIWTAQSKAPRVYLGNSGVVPSWPVIEIHPVDLANERMTIRGRNTVYDLAVVLAVEQASSAEAYEELLRLTGAIETGLFRSYRPLVKPYWEASLIDPTSPDSSTIRVSEALPVGWPVVLEGITDLGPLSLWLTLSSDYGNGVYDLNFPVGFTFPAGSTVIVPRRWIYDSEHYQTQYIGAERILNDDPLLLKTAIIRYRLQEFKKVIPSTEPITL